MSNVNSKELESILTRDLLFDFYGDLLTEHQKRIFEAVVFDDRSISEVAREEGVSRQGISDLIRRAGEQLAVYEEKLKLVQRFREQRETIRSIQSLAERIRKENDVSCAEQIVELTEMLLKES